MSTQLLQRAKIANAELGFQTVFNKALDLVADPVRELAMEVTSTGDAEEYSWLGDVPGLQEWLDDRPMSKLRAEGFTLRNKSWASGIQVHKDTITDDKLGHVTPKIQTLARKAALHPGLLLGRLLLNGFDGTVAPQLGNGKGYDGAFFFADDHQDGSGPAYGNKTDAALSHDAYATARAAMQSYLDEGGEYGLDVMPSTLIVGPALERTAKEIVGASIRAVEAGDGAAAIDNVLAGTARVIVSRALVGTYANYWFLADLTQPVKPLIFQLRESPNFVAATGADSDERFKRGVLKYGVEARHTVGYGLPQYIYGSTGGG